MAAAGNRNDMAESTRFVVAVVDDDHRTLESLADLLEAGGYDVRLYSSARMIWTRGGLSDIDCLISDSAAIALWHSKMGCLSP
jgi:FixJ family two-component response regulator